MESFPGKNSRFGNHPEKVNRIRRVCQTRRREIKNVALRSGELYVFWDCTESNRETAVEQHQSNRRRSFTGKTPWLR